MTNGVPSQVGCQHIEGPLATWTRDSWHGESMGCWLGAIMTRKQLSLAFWWERRKSCNNGISRIQTIKDEGIKNYNKCIITNDDLVKFISGCIL
jgi:hypothetical protein